MTWARGARWPKGAPSGGGGCEEADSVPGAPAQGVGGARLGTQLWKEQTCVWSCGYEIGREGGSQGGAEF